MVLDDLKFPALLTIVGMALIVLVVMPTLDWFKSPEERLADFIVEQQVIRRQCEGVWHPRDARECVRRMNDLTDRMNKFAASYHR
jgi:hypothetical protein